MFVLNGALFGIWASRIPAVAERHQLDHSLLGLLLLCLAAGAIAAFALAGSAADRFGSAQVTRVIALVYSVSLVAISLPGNVAGLAIALFAFGAAHGGMDVAMNAWGAEVERRGKRPMMSSFHAMFSVGAGLGAASGYFAASFELSVFVHFLVASTVVTVLTMTFASIQWGSTPANRARRGAVFALPKGQLFFVGLVAFCSSLGEGAMADWSAILLISSAGVSEATAALGYAAFSAAMVITRFAGGFIVRQYGAVRTVRIGGVASAAGALIAVVGGGAPAVLCGFVFMGLGYALIMPLAFSRAANDPEIPPGAAIAGVATLGYGGLLLGPPLIGFAAEATSLRLAFLILSLLSVISAAMATALGQTSKKEDGGAAAPT
jgi:MFS family permease